MKCGVGAEFPNQIVPSTIAAVRDLSADMNCLIARKQIGVSGDVQRGKYKLLFNAFTALYPVDFRQVESERPDGLDALIVLDGDQAAGLAAAEDGVPSLVIMEPTRRGAPTVDRLVRFNSSPQLNPCLRNQTMIDREDIDFTGLVPEPGDEILAYRGEEPAWLVRPKVHSVCQLVAKSPPELKAHEYLFQYLNGRRFLGLLPIMNFLGQLTRAQDWAGPPSKACFVFDDPSFYWRSYGFLNFGRLAEHATKFNYCVSVATIPLDTWWVNRGVASTLRAYSPRLSILIHGNNHTNFEMLTQDKRVNYREVAAEAMGRMERLVQKHGIPFQKVMEAPYGALGHEMLHPMLAVGYEAALCTTALLVLHNPQVDWPATIGMNRSEMLGGGLPVVPRIVMSPDWKNDVVLAAFLRHPIVVAGHHYDAAHELQILVDLAETINQLESVTWSDMEGILHSNYLQKTEGNTLHVKMFSRRVSVPLKPDIRRICVHRPWIQAQQTERLTITIDGGLASVYLAEAISESFTIETAVNVEISSEIDAAKAVPVIESSTAGLWPIARKIMMETRDRLTPVVPLVNRLRRRPTPL